jgi:pSer/pThr/pTyr-binding forkhead associated (FHA) protein
MKVSLVVASGVHQGKVIPITGPQFLIGRDPQCQLRPASQAISKRHCGVLIRDGKVYVRDFGSTNGTLVNDTQIQGVEVGVSDGATLKLGPLDFTIRIELPAPKPDGTPLPAPTPETAAALAAVKAATKAVSGTAGTAPVRDATPDPAKKVGPPSSKEIKLPPGSKEVAALTGSKEAKALGGSKEAAALKTPATKPVTESSPAPIDSTTEEDHDKIAAMLLGMDEDGNSEVPDGSTVMDLPLPPGTTSETGGGPTSTAGKSDEKTKKPAQSREEMSNAANELLRKYMRRPK